jgi:very-short-patch-repair endonuclease
MGDIDKALRLVEYLTRIARLRTTLTRDVADYEQVLWLSQIPKHQGYFTQAWGPDESFESDVWIEVKNEREPALPAVPDACEDWFDPESIRDKVLTPKLLSEIVVYEEESLSSDEDQDEDERDSDESGQTRLRREDYPEVDEAWAAYVAEKWEPWKTEHDSWAARHQVYSKLFAIHQEQLRRGEDYELVLCLGLLLWQTPSDQRVRRHLVTANASLEFESQGGVFTVRPHPDGSKLGIELDMLDVTEQPVHEEEAGRRALEIAEGDPWNKGGVCGALQKIVHSIDSNGAYIDELEPGSRSISNKPTVVYAPALILRKRSSKSLTDVLKRIKEEIAAGQPIPPKFGDLSEQEDSTQRTQGTTARESGATEARGAELPDEVYFPKPTNDEQRRIIEQLNVSNAVLVQGPPGTGKSHTIANVICHLLATGQRILITAKTPHALGVLEGHVPEPLRALCISLLGNGAEERNSIASSVNGILNKHQNWVASQAETELEALTTKLHESRKEDAELRKRLRAIRESETHTMSVANGAYTGTAAMIARLLDQESETYGWFEDVVPFDKDCPLDSAIFRNLLHGLNLFTEEKRKELDLWIPDLLPFPAELMSIVEKENELTALESGLVDYCDKDLAESLSRTPSTTLEAFLDELTVFNQLLQRLASAKHPWVIDALKDIVTGNSSSWRTVFDVTSEAITHIEPLVGLAESTTLEYPNDRPLRVLLEDVLAIQAHLESGGKLGLGPFRPKTVKDRAYVLSKVRLNGRACSQASEFSELVRVVRVHAAFENVRPYWNGNAESREKPFRLQLQVLQTYLKALDNALHLESALTRLMVHTEHVPVLARQVLHDSDAVAKLFNTIKLLVLRARKQASDSTIHTLLLSLMPNGGTVQPHPLVEELRHAIENRDIEAYARNSAVFERIVAERGQLQQLNVYMRRLGKLTPHLAELLARTHEKAHWQERASRIKEAWQWAQAKSWLDDFIRGEDVNALSRSLEQVEETTRELIKEIASVKAWTECFSRLGDEHRKQMEAWRQAMRRYGAGQGRHAERHRRDARKRLDACRDAVPAWVMPLHRVWDTVTPSPGMFDVVIVDEASQCGIEALPLLFLGKKILVVGDDKQISPDAVGIDRDAVHALMDRFLYDFELKDTFAIESSLFDHGKIRFGRNRVSLREHFRSMPEIIQFSNDLCYSDAPLIPLRQYGPDRLKPLERVHVPAGYREGKGSRVINRPEAEALVETVVELCSDRDYTGKSMGVIVLQGEAQGALIESLLLERLGAVEMESRRLLCGNPYSFQGDERDIIFLSMVTANNEGFASLTKPADERRFNVAASRACDQMWLFHSVNREDLGTNCLRRRLLEFFEGSRTRTIAGIDVNELERRALQDNRQIVKPPRPFDSWFEVDVALDISRAGYMVIPQWEIAGKRIDLVVEGGHARLAVECDGEWCHGLEEAEQDAVRQRILERCGWQFVRVRESAFYANRQFALDGLWRKLDELGIRPQSSDSPDDGSEQEQGKQDISESNSSAGQEERFEERTRPRPTSETGRARNLDLFKRKPHEFTAREIQASILAVLAACPNYSCTEDSLPSRVLKDFGVITRGEPLRKFSQRVARAVTVLENDAKLERYRATNKRVRLLQG